GADHVVRSWTAVPCTRHIGWGVWHRAWRSERDTFFGSRRSGTWQREFRPKSSIRRQSRNVRGDCWPWLAPAARQVRRHRLVRIWPFETQARLTFKNLHKLNQDAIKSSPFESELLNPESEHSAMALVKYSRLPCNQ